MAWIPDPARSGLVQARIDYDREDGEWFLHIGNTAVLGTDIRSFDGAVTIQVDHHYGRWDPKNDVAAHDGLIERGVTEAILVDRSYQEERGDRACIFRCLAGIDDIKPVDYGKTTGAAVRLDGWASPAAIECHPGSGNMIINHAVALSLNPSGSIRQISKMEGAFVGAASPKLVGLIFAAEPDIELIRKTFRDEVNPLLSNPLVTGPDDPALGAIPPSIGKAGMDRFKMAIEDIIALGPGSMGTVTAFPDHPVEGRYSSTDSFIDALKDPVLQRVADAAARKFMTTGSMATKAFRDGFAFKSGWNLSPPFVSAECAPAETAHERLAAIARLATEFPDQFPGT